MLILGVEWSGVRTILSGDRHEKGSTKNENRKGKRLYEMKKLPKNAEAKSVGKV